MMESTQGAGPGRTVEWNENSRAWSLERRLPWTWLRSLSGKLQQTPVVLLVQDLRLTQSVTSPAYLRELTAPSPLAS